MLLSCLADCRAALADRVRSQSSARVFNKFLRWCFLKMCTTCCFFAPVYAPTVFLPGVQFAPTPPSRGDPRLLLSLYPSRASDAEPSGFSFPSRPGLRLLPSLDPTLVRVAAFGHQLSNSTSNFAFLISSISLIFFSCSPFRAGPLDVSPTQDSFFGGKPPLSEAVGYGENQRRLAHERT